MATAKTDAAAAADLSADQKAAPPPPVPSAASFAAGIKYAEPRSLPSFPSSGFREEGSAASAAAASLGFMNQKPVELWKPGKLSSASAAAALAHTHDHKMPAWQPTTSPGSHRAAVLAVDSAGAALKHASVSMQSSPQLQQDAWGNTAATQAFHASRPTSTIGLAVGSTHRTSTISQNINFEKLGTVNNDSHDQAVDLPANRPLVAAQGAMATRQRAVSAASLGFKEIEAAEASAAAAALNGATSAHRASMQIKMSPEEVGAVPVTSMARTMFTANPPVKLETDEETANEKLHQSAVEMAKRMYRLQQVAQANSVKQTESSQRGRASQPIPYESLQDAAYRQAQERLAKLHEEHFLTREYQEYYGNEPVPRKRLSMMSKLRRRSVDEDEDAEEEEEDDDDDDADVNRRGRRAPRRLRPEASIFASKLSQVDQEKRARDRESLLAIAQRNVKARLEGLDEMVYQETGRVNPALLSEWEQKAHDSVQARHDSQASVERDDDAKKQKTRKKRETLDVGGGRFMAAEEVDAIASDRIQPVLHDINEKAEIERERKAMLKMDEEARLEAIERRKTRDREMRELDEQTREEDKQARKAKKSQFKQEAKAKREEEKLRKDDRKEDEKMRREEEKAQERAKKEEDKASKRLAKEEKRKSRRGVATATTATAAAAAAAPLAATDHGATAAPALSAEPPASTRPAAPESDVAETRRAAATAPSPPPPESPAAVQEEPAGAYVEPAADLEEEEEEEGPAAVHREPATAAHHEEPSTQAEEFVDSRAVVTPEAPVTHPGDDLGTEATDALVTPLVHEGGASDTAAADEGRLNETRPNTRGEPATHEAEQHLQSGGSNADAEEPAAVGPDTNASKADHAEAAEAASSASSTSKVRGWIRKRFSRGKSENEQADKRRSFLGGAAMKDSKDVNHSKPGQEAEEQSTHGQRTSTTSAGGDHADGRTSQLDSQGVSPESTPLEEEAPQLESGEAGKELPVLGNGLMADIEPPRPIEDPVMRKSSSPTRDSRFREEINK